MMTFMIIFWCSGHASPSIYSVFSMKACNDSRNSAFFLQNQKLNIIRNEINNLSVCLITIQQKKPKWSFANEQGRQILP